ncbi:MAG TPA: gamma-glutamyltransferase family protein [Nocardioidaceae bacterium]|nr:gamma-glutamyltransferase family protein [Nocardioidaceae bacterium]
MTMTTRPELIGSFGMVASTHWLASASGMSVLERGGNAFDAAVAAGFVLQVVEPHQNGPAGDLSALAWSAADEAASVVCGQGVSPAASSIEHFTDLGLNLVPGSGLLAATVPGSFGAWMTMLERWGTWEINDVLAYALHYAESGFPVRPDLSATISAVSDLFAHHWTPSGEVWLDGPSAPRAGSQWTLPATAATYRRLLSEAVGTSREARIEAVRRAYYSGFVAEAIDRFSRMSWRDASGVDHAGLLTGEDLAGWKPPVEPPVTAQFAGRYELLKTGPWGQGPVLLQQLGLLDAVRLLETDLHSVEWVHLITEVAKLAFADREAWYGDPVDSDVPLQKLLSAEYCAERAHLIDASANRDLRPGSPDDRIPVLPTLPEPRFDEIPDATSGEPTMRAAGPASGDTVHVDVVDRWGNLVSATPSGGWLQSSPVIPELGFPLGTRGQMFYLHPGLPNSLRPGVRPRTTLTPSIALREGEPWLAFGSPGGDQQDQWQTAFFAHLIHADLRGKANLQASIDAPMFHTTHFPSSFYPRDAHPGEIHVEDRLPPSVVAGLRARGHDVIVTGPWQLGRLSVVAKDGDRLLAAANPRGAQGYAVGR